MWPKTSLLASPVTQSAPHPTSQLSKDDLTEENRKKEMTPIIFGRTNNLLRHQRMQFLRI